MMWKQMICVTALAFSGYGWAEQSDQEVDELRQEIRQARQELRAASRKLESLTERQVPGLSEDLSYRLGDGFNYSFSSGGKRPMVGIIMNGSKRNRGGVLLSGITPEAPADKAGLESGDLLTSIDGHDLSGRNGLRLANEILDNLEIGESFEFTYERDGKSYTTTVVVEEHEPSLAFSFNSNGNWFDFDTQPFNFGFNFGDETFSIDPEQLRNLTDQYRNWSFDAKQMSRFRELKNLPYIWSSGWAWSGLELKQVNTGLGRYFGTDSGALVLEAQDLGDSDLQSGDVIIAIEDDTVANPKQAMRLLRRFAAGEQITARIMRDGKQRDVVLFAPESRGSSYSFSWSSDDEE